MSGLSKLGVDVSAIYARATADGQKVFAVCFYAFASVSMTLVNKGAVKAIPFPYFLCLIQNALTIVIALFVALVLAPGHDKLGLKLKITQAVLITWMPALILFVLMLISSMSAMKYLAVPSVLVFRALTPLATAAFSMCLLENSIPSKAEWASLAVIVVGAACYLAADPSFSLYGYAWMLLNLFAAALYHVYVKRCINKLTPSTMDLVLLNNVLSIPIFLLLGATIDDPVGLVQQLQHVSLGGWLAVLGSCIVAGLIAFSGFFLQAAVSPTTATVINHLTKVCTFIASYLIFQDRFGAWMLVGVILTLAGTIWYTALTKKGPPPPPPETNGKAGVQMPAASENTSLLANTNNGSKGASNV